MKGEKKKQILKVFFSLHHKLYRQGYGKEIPGSGSNKPGQIQLQVEGIILMKLVSCI